MVRLPEPPRNVRRLISLRGKSHEQVEQVFTRASRIGVRDDVTSTEAQRVKELERENKELRRANEILKVASAFFAQAELDRRFKS